jgi:uncharacterized protein
VSERPFRVLPKVTPSNEHYWTGGAHGELRILRCDDCRYWVHPPAPVCGQCLGRSLTPQAVSGRGTVHSYTLNHQEWNPTMVHPYAIVLVDLPEQDGLRILTNLVDCPPEQAEIGMSVEACFEEHGDVWLPMFRPRS